MKRTHALAISLLLAVAVVAGAFAAYTTAGLGAESEPASALTTEIAAREAELDRYEQELRTALAQEPPPPPSLAERSPAPGVAPLGTVPGPAFSYDDEDDADHDDETADHDEDADDGEDDD